jgi:urea carboxylase
VHVNPGATVAAGDVLLVIESMKMEISVTAPCAGIIDEVHVAPGSPVRAGQRVVVIGRA